MAHALLLRSVPEANGAVDRAPAQVELLFSESLDGSFSRVTVLDSTGKTVDNGDSRVDPADLTRMTVSLPSLPDGVYTVSWKALSAVDGHVTTGAYPFAVGNVDAADLAAAAQASRQVKLPLGEVLARWLAYLAVATIVGGQIFVLLVWQPARDSLAAERPASAKFSPPGTAWPPARWRCWSWPISLPCWFRAGKCLAPSWPRRGAHQWPACYSRPVTAAYGWRASR